MPSGCICARETEPIIRIIGEARTGVEHAMRQTWGVKGIMHWVSGKHKKKYPSFEVARTHPKTQHEISIKHAPLLTRRKIGEYFGLRLFTLYIITFSWVFCCFLLFCFCFFVFLFFTVFVFLLFTSVLFLFCCFVVFVFVFCCFFVFFVFCFLLFFVFFFFVFAFCCCFFVFWVFWFFWVLLFLWLFEISRILCYWWVSVSANE